MKSHWRMKKCICWTIWELNKTGYDTELRSICYKWNWRWTITHSAEIAEGVKGCFLGLFEENRPPLQTRWRACSPNAFYPLPGNLAKLHFAAFLQVESFDLVLASEMWIHETYTPAPSRPDSWNPVHHPPFSSSPPCPALTTIWWVSWPTQNMSAFLMLSLPISAFSTEPAPVPWSPQPATTVTWAWDMLSSF